MHRRRNFGARQSHVLRTQLRKMRATRLHLAAGWLAHVLSALHSHAQSRLLQTKHTTVPAPSNEQSDLILNILIFLERGENTKQTIIIMGNKESRDRLRDDDSADAEAAGVVGGEYSAGSRVRVVGGGRRAAGVRRRASTADVNDSEELRKLCVRFASLPPPLPPLAERAGAAPLPALAEPVAAALRHALLAQVRAPLVQLERRQLALASDVHAAALTAARVSACMA